MNANYIINLVIRQIVNRVIRVGLDAGFNKMSSVGKAGKRPDRAEERRMAEAHDRQHRY